MGRQGREGGAGALERWIPKASVQTYLWGLVCPCAKYSCRGGGGKKEISMKSDRPCPVCGASNSENIYRDLRRPFTRCATIPSEGNTSNLDVPIGYVTIYISVQQKERREIHVHSGAHIGSNERIHPYVDMTPLPPNFMWGALSPSSGCEERLVPTCKWT